MLSCWAERRASSFKTLLRNPLPSPPSLYPGSGEAGVFGTAVAAFVALFKANEHQIETHCFIRLMLSLRGSVRFSIQLMSKCYLLTKIVFMN